MRQIQISDVQARLSALGKIREASEKANYAFIEGANLALENKRPCDIKRFIETSAKPNTPAQSFSKVLDLYDSLIEVGSLSDVQYCGRVIYEGTVKRSRSAKQLQTLIRMRLTRLKNKLKPKRKAIQDAAIIAYERMLENSIVYDNCDRLINNYNNISKRFNLEILFNENTKANGVRDTVVELCNRIDTYEIPNQVKFNSVIETAWYGFESNHIDYKKSDIVECAVDYFLFKENGLNDCKEILEATMFFDKNEDMGNIDIFTEEEPEKDNTVNSVEDSIMNHFSSNSKKVVEESVQFKEIFDKFKKEELSKGHPENKLKSLITKLYARNVDSIVEDTPDLLQWLRSFFLIGSCAIPYVGPVITIIGFIADRFISLHTNRNESKKMIKCFDNEIKASKKKLKTVTNADDKNRLNEYIKSLEKTNEKIIMYYNSMLTEKDYENPEDDDLSYSIDIDDDFDFDFDDDDDDFLEFVSFSNNLERICEIYSNPSLSADDMYIIAKESTDNDDIINIANIASRHPDIFFNESLSMGFKDNIAEIRKDQTKYVSVVERSLKLLTLNNAIELLSESKGYEFNSSMYDTNAEFASIIECYDAIIMMRNAIIEKNNKTLMEASISNSLKMTSMKLRNAMTRLSDKDRQISKSIDLGLNNVIKSAERSLTNDNRESIIKGSMLPSASKIIKMGIVNAGLVAIGQPVLAVIGTIGYLATSAKFKAKERQMLIDELEIELKMCQKYIEIAEQKNDMKALKQLMMIQRDLQRQIQRIKYKMRVQFSQKYYDPKHVGDE